MLHCRWRSACGPSEREPEDFCAVFVVVARFVSQLTLGQTGFGCTEGFLGRELAGTSFFGLLCRCLEFEGFGIGVVPGFGVVTQVGQTRGIAAFHVGRYAEQFRKIEVSLFEGFFVQADVTVGAAEEDAQAA